MVSLSNHEGGRPVQNILFITADQWRADCTGYAGHPLVKTPNLDRLAADGVAFLNHYANAAPCSPARACLYTGLYQMNNRVVRNGSPLDDRFDNIARAARRAGYDPTLFGYTDQSPDPRDPAARRSRADHLRGRAARLLGARPAARRRTPLALLAAPAGSRFRRSSRAHLPVGAPPAEVSSAPSAYSAEQTQTAFIAGEFIRWLGEQQTATPWFAHLSFLRPHPPFIVPAPYHTMFDPLEVDGFTRAETAEAEAALHPLLSYQLDKARQADFVPGTKGLVRDLTEAEFRQIKATYYGMIAEVDAQLGRVFAALQNAGGWDETLIVFTSDHAEMLGDHFSLGKGGFFDESQRMPLIIRDPAQPVGHGRSVDAFTEAVDLFPTLLDALALSPNHHPDGQSLMPFLAGQTPTDWRDAVHWEFDFRDIAGQKAERRFGLASTQLAMAAIRDARHKYVHFTGLKPLLFDMERDPGNLHNLADDPASLPIRLSLAEKLLAWRAEHLDQTLALSELTAAGVVRLSSNG